MPRYSTIWRNKFLREAESIDDLISVFKESIVELQELKEAGINFEFMDQDWYSLYTYDKTLAEKFDLHEDEEEEEDYEEGGEG